MRRAMALGVIVAACAHTPAFRIASQLDLDEPFRYTLDVDAFRLPNGLTVVLAPQAGANLVTVDVRYEAGSADEPAGKTGLAHLVEHLTFQGRGAAGEPVLEARLAAAALYFNAYTSEDATHYDATALASALPELLRVEAARMAMTCDAIDDDLFERERGVVAQELLQRRMDVWAPLRVAVFGADHPYAHDVGGRDLASITRKDVCAFLDAHYAPDRAILVVGGAFDRKLARAAIIGRFGHPGRHGAPAAAPPPIPPSHGGFARVVADVDQPALLFAYPRPRFGSADAVAQRMCSWLIEQQLHELDADRADIVATDVFDWGGSSAGATMLEVVLAKDADPTKVAKAVQDKLEEMEKSQSWWQVAQMHGYFDGELVRRYDDLSSRGAMIADYMQFTGDASLHVRDLERVRKLEARDVLAYLQDHFVEAHPALIHVVPAEASRAPASIRNLHPSGAPDLSSDRLPVDEAEADRPLAAPVTTPPSYDEIRLDNGLRVIFAPRPASATFAALLLIPTGIADDPPDRPATARIALHTLRIDWDRAFSGPEHQYLTASSRAGTFERRSVDDHTTTFAVDGLASFADWHVWRLHYWLESGGFDAKAVADADRNEVSTKHRRRTTRFLAALLDPADPLVRNLDPAHVTVTDLEAFRATRYVATGATLIIAGNFDRARIESEVRELWGVWRRAAAAAHRSAEPPLPRGPVVLATDDDAATQIHIRIGFRARSTWADQHPVRAVAVRIVRARLRAIREELAASYGLDAGYRADLGPDVLEVEGDVNAAQAGPAIARVQRELADLHDHAATFRAEFVRARRGALGDELASDGSAQDAVEGAVSIAARGLPLSRLSEIPAQIARVRPADVGALLAGDLDPTRMVIQISGPGAHAAAMAAGLNVNTP